MTGIGLGIAFIAGVGLGRIGFLLVVAVALFVWSLGWCRLPAVCLALLLCLAGVWRMPEAAESGGSLDLNGAVTVTGTVVSFPVATSSGQSFDLQVDSGQGIGNFEVCVVSAAATSVDRGSAVRLTGVATAVADIPKRLQGALEARGCVASVYSRDIELLGQPSRFQELVNSLRERIAGVFQRAAPGDTGALMTGLVTGDDSGLSTHAKSAFLTTGTSHITAVSGSNFALVVLIATVLAGNTGVRRRLSWIGATTTAIWAYAILVGLPPSATRAALMATFALAAAYFGRRPDFVTLLFVCGALQVAARPSDLESLSFQLSFAATLALVLVLPGRDMSRGHWLVAILVTAVAAHLATIPVLAYRLGEFAPATIPTNVLISPMTMIGFSLAAIASMLGLISEEIGVAAAIPARAVSAGMLGIVERASRILPGNMTVGNVSGGSLVALMALCWGGVLLMSSDARTAFDRASGRLSGSSPEVRIALLSTPIVALVTIVAGMLAR